MSLKHKDHHTYMQDLGPRLDALLEKERDRVFEAAVSEGTDKRPRLEIGFGVNAERWLCATVRDLRTGKALMNDEAVVRLL